MQNSIIIKGARENNLKNIDLEIPRDKLVVITGLSGSGKSSLAFDTLYAEGQRRYVESLSSYARMFLGQMDKPDVDYIDGLSPAISIDQKTTSKNPRSTVGTVTEIYDYLRLLWARIGVPHCPKCGKEIRQQSIDQIVDRILELPEGTRIQLLAPVIRSRKGEHVKVLEDAKKSGYVRARVDGILYDLSDEIKLEKNKKHDIEIVVDRLVIKPELSRRLTDSAETALALSGGLLFVDLVQTGEILSFSQNYACEDCGISLEELTPRLFSFNNPHGACPKCTGLGTQMLIDPELIIPNPNLSIQDGGIQASGWGNVRNDSIARMYFEALGKRYHFKLSDPISSISKEGMDAILFGTHGEPLALRYERSEGFGVIKREFEGIVVNLERRYRETQSPSMPGMQGQAPQARSSRRYGRRHKHCGVQQPVRHRGASLHRKSSAQRPRTAHRRSDPQGDPLPSRFSGERRSELSHTLPHGGYAFRRREPAHPSGYADRLQSDGRAVHSG